MNRILHIAQAVLAMAVLAVALPTHQLTASPARPLPKTITQPDGSKITIQLHGDEWCHWVTNLEGQHLTLNADGFYRLSTEAQLAEFQRYQASQRATAQSELPDNHLARPTKGKVNVLVVLVEYQDVRFKASADETYNHFNDMMTKDGFDYTVAEKYRHYGSAHNYFVDNSMGVFDPQFDVYGPILLQNDRSYYGANSGGNDKNAAGMIVEACQQLDSLGVDFTKYDSDNDGMIDYVFAYYPGGGENESGMTSDAVWPHQSSVISHGYQCILDGKQLSTYACSCELFGDEYDGVGTFCHEFSHCLGLLDEYSTSNQSGTLTPQEFSVMHSGCYLLNAYWPCGHTAYQRYELGWIQPTPLESDVAVEKSLSDFGTTNQAFIVRVDGTESDPRDGEYYLFENRQKTNWDKYIPGHGMLVWHIDYNSYKWRSNTINTYQDHQMIDLVEADATITFQCNRTPFPGESNISSFTDDTNPAFCGWTERGSSSGDLGIRLNKPITNIHETADTNIVFHFMGTPEHLSSIQSDAAAHQIRIIDGQPVIVTSDGSQYTLQGQRK